MTDQEKIAQLEKEIEHLKEKMISPYESWEINKPVWVRDSIMVPWVGAHYAGLNSNNEPVFWVKGRTSHTSENFTTWRFAKETLE